VSIFTITLTRNVTESIMIEVRAYDDEEARQFVSESNASEIESCAKDGSTWEVDADSRLKGDMYITDIGTSWFGKGQRLTER